jgi:hypothetical protein
LVAAALIWCLIARLSFLTLIGINRHIAGVWDAAAIIKHPVLWTSLRTADMRHCSTTVKLIAAGGIGIHAIINNFTGLGFIQIGFASVSAALRGRRSGRWRC